MGGKKAAMEWGRVRTANRFVVWLAKLFGKKFVGLDVSYHESVTVEMRYWRGKHYVISEKVAKRPEQGLPITSSVDLVEPIGKE